MRHDMKVIIDQKERNITGLKTVSYPRISAINDEEVEIIDYAQYVIQGRNSNWVDWTPLDKFVKDNPGVI